jgi:cell division control protein 42
MQISRLIESKSTLSCAGLGDMDPRMTPFPYPQTDAFLICFSIAFLLLLRMSNPKWSPKIQLNHPNTPIILVGTKSDLRADDSSVSKLTSKGLKMIEKELALEVAKEIGAVEYHECSALTQEGMRNVFDRAIHVGLTKSKKQQESGCTLL